MKHMHKHQDTPRTLRQDQSGLVSFFVTVIIMMILSLIVLSFARITQREQRQTLDRQLNTQAFYAAESGVNDALAVLRNVPLDDPRLAADYTSSCEGFGAAFGLPPGEMDPLGPISYSCLMVDLTPRQLRFEQQTGQSQVLPIQPESSLATLRIEWRALHTNTPSISGCPAALTTPGTFLSSMPSAPQPSCDFATLRIEFVPVPVGGATRAQMMNERAIFFVQPMRHPACPDTDPDCVNVYPTTGFTSGQGSGQGRPVAARRCLAGPGNATQACMHEFTGMGAFGRGYVRITPLYHGTNAVITGLTSGNDQVSFRGAQVAIDVTGKANDVLKRIVVHRPLQTASDGSNPLPGFALQSEQTQCKRRLVGANNTSNSECP